MTGTLRLPPLARLTLLAAILVALAVFVVGDTPPPAQAQVQTQPVETTIWSATLTVQARGTGSTIGCDNGTAGSECSTASILTDDDFTIYDVEYHVVSILNDPIPITAIRFDKALPEYLLSTGKLTVDGVGYSLADASVVQSGIQLGWGNIPRWSVGDTVQLQLTMATPGALDPDFSSASTVLTPFGSGDDEAYAMAVQSDGKIVVAGSSANGSTTYFALARYTADGTLDTTFGTGGKVTTDFDSSYHAVRAVAIQSDGKIVAAGYSNNNFALARYTTTGVLDTTFSSDGKVTTAIGSGDDEAYAIAIQSDGKIVVAGFSHNGTNNDFALARYTTTGALDTSFGTDGPDMGTDPDGYVTTAIGSSHDTANAIAIQSGGKIVVAGGSHNGTDFDFALARYTTAGVLDTTFGTGGKVITAIGSGDDFVGAMAIQSDDKILAAGTSEDNFALARYTATGGLDTSFGTDGPDTGTAPDGHVTTAIGSGSATAYAIAVQSDGKVLVAGDVHNGSNDDFALVRYSKAGVLDPTFGSRGTRTTDFGSGHDIARAVAILPSGHILAAGHGSNGSNDDFALAAYTAYGAPAAIIDGPGWLTTAIGSTSSRANAIAVQPDGKIVAAGGSSTSGGSDFALARYRADGSPDTGFGTGGKVTTNVGSSIAVAYAVAVQSDGKIVAAGEYNNDFAVARNNPDGTLDTGFGSSGWVTTDFGTGSDSVRAMALQPDGKIVVAGIDQVIGGDFQFALARYNANGTLDSGFGTGGKVTTDIGSGDDDAYAMAIQSDGKILVAGESNDDFALARYNADGTLDTTFGTDGPDADTAPDGHVTTAIGSGADVARAIAVQSDGKILVAGFSHNGTNNDFALARYTKAGVLDTGFGTGGKVTTAIGTGGDEASDVAIQSDDKIVVAGFSHNGTNNDFALARYTKAGVLDTIFGAGGKVATDISSRHEIANAVAIQSDGKIVAAGNSSQRNDGTDDGFAVARYLVGQVMSSNANLGGLSASDSTNLDRTFTALTLSPAFSSSTTGYTARVPNPTTFVKLSPTVEATGRATVEVGRQGETLRAVTDTRPSEAFAMSVGSGNVFTVRVTAEDGTTKDYTVTVTRDEPPLNVRLSIDPNPSPENAKVNIRAVLSKRVDNDVSIPIQLLWGQGVENGQVVDYGTLDQGDLPGKLGRTRITELDGTKYVAFTFPTQIRINSGILRRTSGILNLAVLGNGATKGESFTVRLDTGHPDWPSFPTRIPAGSPSSVKVQIGEPEPRPDGGRPRQGDGGNPWPLSGVRVCWNDETPVGSDDCGPARPTHYGYGIRLPGPASHVTVAPTLAAERSGASLQVGRVTYGTDGHGNVTESVSYSAVSSDSPSGAISLNTDKITTIIRVRVTGNGPLSTITLAVDRPAGGGNGEQGNQGSQGSPGSQDEPVAVTLPTTVTLSLDPDTVGEKGGPATITATLDEPALEGGVSLHLYPSNDSTAVRDADYTLPASVAIAAGNRSGTALVRVINDALDEPDERAVIAAYAEVFGFILVDSVTLTITDDDTAGITVSAPSPLTVDEGDRASYSVVLDSQPTADVKVTATSGDGAKVSVFPSAITFTPEDWNEPDIFYVDGLADEDSNDESVAVSHSVTSDDALYGAVIVSTVPVRVSDTTVEQESREQSPQEKYADLIASMKEWRNDPRYVHDKAHTDRWDRTLLAFGEPVDDTTLTPMTATEAQTYADRGWTRWVEVAKALRELENQAPTVSSAISDATIVNQSGSKAVSLSGVFEDGDGDSLTITAKSSAETVATVSVAADYSTLTVTAKSRGTATITVTAADGKGGTVDDTFTVTVKAAPTVSAAIADLSLEVGGTQDITLSSVFSDADGDSMTFTASSTDEDVANPLELHGTLTIIGGSAGSATVTVTAQDADGNTVSDAFDVSVPGAGDDNGEPPAVVNLRCRVNTDQLLFRWDAPEWSGGETYAYDFHLTLPDGGSDSGRVIGGPVLFRTGEYQAGGEAGASVKAVYQLPDGSRVTSAEATLTCTVKE